MENRDTVLITGASSGIGLEFAKVFALNKYNLILTARSTEKLEKLAWDLKSKYEIDVYTITQDLSLPGAAKKVYDEVKNRNLNIDILVNNAGVGKVGLFHEIELADDIEMIQLNITALTEMTKLFSRDMVSRKKGKILNIASTGSFSPGPIIAVYYATKAYVLSFSRAIASEVKPYNVTVTALCPGATKTNFSEVAGKVDPPGAMKPETVARIGFNAVLKGKRVVIPGLWNKMSAVLPQNLMSSLVGKYQKSLMKQ
jgi:short-subunit dehydrogenase